MSKQVEKWINDSRYQEWSRQVMFDAMVGIHHLGVKAVDEALELLRGEVVKALTPTYDLGPLAGVSDDDDFEQSTSHIPNRDKEDK